MIESRGGGDQSLRDHIGMMIIILIISDEDFDGDGCDDNDNRTLMGV